MPIAALAICALAVCNEVARRIALGIIREDFSQLKITLRFSEGLPNLAATDSVRITDTCPIIRAAPSNSADDCEAHIVQRRQSWTVPNSKPVHNYCSQGQTVGIPPVELKITTNWRM